MIRGYCKINEFNYSMTLFVRDNYGAVNSRADYAYISGIPGDP